MNMVAAPQPQALDTLFMIAGDSISIGAENMTDSESAREHPLRNRLGSYLDEQCMRLTEHFAAAVRDGDAGAIHKCRVALRRQRSVLRQFRQLMPRRRR